MGKINRDSKGVRLTSFHQYEVILQDKEGKELNVIHVDTYGQAALTAAASASPHIYIKIFDPVLGQEISTRALFFLESCLNAAGLGGKFK